VRENTPLAKRVLLTETIISVSNLLLSEGVKVVYLRWKKKQTRYFGIALNAVLVKSERVNGQPRQKFIRHLASIHEDHLTDIRKASNFWLDLEYRLSMLNLSVDQVKAIRQKATLVVPSPSGEEIEETKRYNLSTFGWISRAHIVVPTGCQISRP